MDTTPKVKSVSVAGRVVEVREIGWRDALQLVRDISKTLARFVTIKGKDKTQTLDIDLDKIIDGILENEKTALLLVEKSIAASNVADCQQWLSSLTVTQFGALLDAAIEINLSPEVIGTGKMLAGRMTGVLGLGNQSTAQLISSSDPATATATRSA